MPFTKLTDILRSISFSQQHLYTADVEDRGVKRSRSGSQGQDEDGTNMSDHQQRYQGDPRLGDRGSGRGPPSFRGRGVRGGGRGFWDDNGGRGGFRGGRGGFRGRGRY